MAIEASYSLVARCSGLVKPSPPNLGGKASSWHSSSLISPPVIAGMSCLLMVFSSGFSRLFRLVTVCIRYDH